MKLLRCHIENFGILSDFELNFSDGLNVIYKENGSGKSTLAAFIKAMFYGLPKKGSRSIVANDRKRYNPWQGGNYGGFLEFNYQGTDYRVTRYFGNTAAKDQFDIIDLTNRKNETPFTENLGEEIFGLDEESFARSTFMNQFSLENSGATTSIRTKLTNLVDNTNDMNNYDTASKALRDYRIRIKPLRGNGGVIGRLDDERNKLDAQKFAAESKKSRLDEVVSRIEQINDKKTAKEAELAYTRERIRSLADNKVFLIKARQLNDLRQEISDVKVAVQNLEDRYSSGLPTEDEISKCKLASDEILVSKLKLDELGLTNEEEKLIEELENKINSNASDNNSKLSSSILFSIIGVIAILCGIGAFAFKYSIIGVIALALGLLCLLTGFYSHIKKMINERNIQLERRLDEEKLDKLREKKLSIQVDQNNLNERIARNSFYINDVLRKYEIDNSNQDIRDSISLLSQLCDDYSRRHSMYKERFNEAIAKYESFKIENKDNLDRIVELANSGDESGVSNALMDAERLEAFEKNLLTELDSIDKDISSLRQIRESLRVEVEKIPEYEDQLVRIEDELAESTRKYELADKTMDFLSRAKNNLASSYVGDIENRFLKYANLLLENQIGEVMLDKELNLLVDEKGAQRELGSFSSGTIDSILLCMRLGLVDSLFKDEKPFLILDDPFVNLDDNHMNKALEMLKKIALNYQIIYFVCNKSRQ